MRTKNSIRNALVAFISNFISIICGFGVQIFFIRYLGKEYLGLNGLFTNVVSMLSIVELGLGTAMIYHLYKPVSEKNYELIKSLMAFYKKSYNLISLTIFILGMVLLPFLHLFVETSLEINIYFIFMLFVIESSISYLFSYKRSILLAFQENYIINIVRIIYTILLNLLQVLILIFTKRYVLFLILKIIFRLLENIVISFIANKKYTFIKDKDVKPLEKSIKEDIFLKIKGLFLHKIGGYVVLGTDNIIISKFVNLVSVGIFSNYTMIINGIKSLFSQMFGAITTSVGNLLVTDLKEKNLKVFENINFINYWLSSFCGISFYFISKPFISIWIGKEFLLSSTITFTLMIQLYLDIYGYTIGAFKNGGGIFHEDRWVPIIQSVVNIIVSIILVKLMGVVGVVIGTLFSYMVLYLYSYPVIVFRKLFDKNYLYYIKIVLKHFLVFIVSFVICLLITNSIIINNVFLELIFNILVSIIIPNLIIVLIYKNSDEFDFFVRTIIKKKILKK